MWDEQFFLRIHNREEKKLEDSSVEGGNEKLLRWGGGGKH